MKQLNNVIIILSIILSFLGFLDASYLTILHYKNIIPPCSIAHGCETVLTSKFAVIGPVPIALLGVGFYLAILVLLGLLLENKQELKIKLILLAVCSFGLVVSIILVGIQAFILHAFCQWCLTSEGINLLIFLFTIKIYRNKQIND